MGQGRHRAGHGTGHRRTSTGVRKAAPGARKAPPAARRASPARVGAARVVGRRAANRDGRPVVLTALGSGEKVFALLPLTLLSVAWVVGLAANGDGDPSASPSPVDTGTTAAPLGHAAAPRQAPVNGTATSARPSISETESPVATDEGTSPPTVEQGRDPGGEPTVGSPRVEPPAAPTDGPNEAGQPPAPSASPATTPDTTEDDVLTKAEATVRCLQSGISSLDVAALAACVDELLG